MEFLHPDHPFYMKTTFAKRCWRIARWMIALYFVLFAFRFVYGYFVTGSQDTSYNAAFFDGLANVRKNYASEKGEVSAMQLADGGHVSSSSQKYEKTAVVTSKSTHFEDDDKAIRAKAASYKGIIQYENSFGLKGRRELHMLIGITPEAFDSFYVDIRKIGVIQSMSVTKEDKTNEYRQLNAQKASLEKTLASLQELKSKGGEISDYVALHDKILEIESKLQDLGVQLGNFNADNEFCTVKLSLYEGQPAKGVSMFHRIKVAVEWSLQYYVFVLAGLLLVSVIAFIILLIADKLKVMQVINKDN